MAKDMSRHSLYIFNFSEGVIFIAKFIVFAILSVSYFFRVMPQYEGHYTAALIDKVDRLRSIDVPKIVLLGNSNLSFGIDSVMIEEKIGMPVVNMGLHGGLGNRFHEEMARYNVTEGDIYILCHSSFADDGAIADTTLAWTTIEDHFLLWKLLRPSDIYPMLKAYPTYLKRCLDLYVEGTGNVDTGEIYARSAFNRYGDIAVEREGSVYTFEGLVEPPMISETTMERINELGRWLEKRNAILLVAAYPIGLGELTVDKNVFIRFQERLEEQLECPVISQYTDYMYEYSLFYNTHLHLNNEGVTLRTEQLIKDIKKWRKNSG